MTSTAIEVEVVSTPQVGVDVQVAPPTFTVVSVLPTGPRGPVGATGAAGAQGPAGPAGAAGQGVPTGGTAGQVLTKDTVADFDTSWQDAGGAVDSVNGETGVVVLEAADVGAQPADADLTAIAALATQAYGRSLLTLADAAAGRTSLGLGTAATANTGDFDAAGTAAAAVAALVDSAPGTLDTLNELAAALGDDPNFATTITDTLAGKQPLDADLTAIAALTTTAYGRSVLEAANAAALRTLAGLVIGTDVQAFDADLSTIAAANNGAVLAATTASFTTADETKLDGIEALADVTDAANVAAAGAAMRAGAEFGGTSPVSFDNVTGVVYVPMPNGTVNGFVAKVNGASAGYGKGQAFMVLEEGSGDATLQTSAGSILFRVDEFGGIGTNSGLHIATGLRKTVPVAPAGLWITPSQDVIHILAKRLAGSTLPFFRATTEADVTLLDISSSGSITTTGSVTANGLVGTTASNGSTTAAAIYGGDAGVASFRAIFSTIANTTAGLALLGTAAQAANMLQIGTGVTIWSRFDKAGYFMTRKVAAPADADLAASELAVWFDSTNGSPKLMLKAKQANGTAVTGGLLLDGLSDGAVRLTGNQTVAGTKTFSSDVVVPDEVYGVGWNGSLEVPTKNAVYDKIETLGGGSVSDTAYGSGWDGDTTVAPSKNAVYDKIEALAPLPVRTSFTPTWTSTGTAPAIGNGTLSGEYAVLGGGLMWLRIFLQFGSTTTGGTGDWSFALPAGFTLASGNQVMNGYAEDDSAGTRHIVAAQINSAVAGKVNRVYRQGTGGLNAAVPFTWANVDSMTVEGVIAYA